MTLLRVDNLSVAFHQMQGVEKHVVKNVSFSLDKSETLALVGESGSGKSITALSILGLLPYPQAYHPTGSILFQGQEMLNQSESFLRSMRGAHIGMIFQEPMTALNPLHTIEKQIGEPLRVHKGFNKIQAKDRVKDLLNLVGFPEGIQRLDTFPHQLSGGQRQRVMIAMALACNPKLLIADEPTTALDVTLQAGILDLIKSIQSQLKMALLLISHDLGVVSHMAENIAVMRWGEIVEQGETPRVLKNPTHDYTRHLVQAEPKGSPAPLVDTRPILMAENLCVTFAKDSGIFFKKKVHEVKALDHVSLTVNEGETVGIVGESGSGKSTLAYSLLRLQHLNQGVIHFDGHDIHTLSLRQMQPLRQRLQIIFQDPFGSLNPRFSIFQIIEEGLTVHRKNMSEAEREHAVATILQEVGLETSARNRYPHEFSGGQRQRIAIARALILQPQIMLLDEPTSALDRSIQAEIMDLLRSVQQKYKLSYLFISHDLKVVQAMSHRIVVMKDGKIIEQGSTSQIFQQPQTLYTKNLINASFQL
jgi:microcin C transport system ATP-binding protein